MAKIKRQEAILLISLLIASPILFGTVLYLSRADLPKPEVAIATSRVTAPRTTLNDVRRDWGIEGRLDCRVVPQGATP